MIWLHMRVCIYAHTCVGLRGKYDLITYALPHICAHTCVGLGGKNDLITYARLHICAHMRGSGGKVWFDYICASAYMRTHAWVSGKSLIWLHMRVCGYVHTCVGLGGKYDLITYARLCLGGKYDLITYACLHICAHMRGFRGKVWFDYICPFAYMRTHAWV